MENAKPVRIPRQIRSLATKEKLIVAAKELFCQKGYDKTTANAIARKAGTSVGSFYAYFADKEAVFAELMERICLQLRAVVDEFSKELRQPGLNKKEWIGKVTRKYVQIVLSEPQLAREIAVLYYSGKPRIVAMMQRQQTSIQQMLGTYFGLMGIDTKGKDTQVSAILFQKTLVQLPEKILYGWEGISQERLIVGAVEVLYKYLS
ncbi:MAG: TetR/AcrR family transcriptional regulator [Ethanoligenens sp.]|uniref:TetR/AcrR family transcriptional regulator n=1 Tax=Ethanoligenens sp. TaxID=2099655 RepID=UPI0039EC5CF4